MINIELKNKNLIDNSNKIKKHIDSTEYPIQTKLIVMIFL